jgi:hypothetical protein
LIGFAGWDGNTVHVVQAIPYEDVLLAVHAGSRIGREENGLIGAGMRRDGDKQRKKKSPNIVVHASISIK